MCRVWQVVLGWALALRPVPDIPGYKLYDAIRHVIFDSFRDPSLDGEIFETFKWLAYEKWDSQKRSLPDFQCPHCDSAHATLPFDAVLQPFPETGGNRSSIFRVIRSAH
jgi:hypothetical protein